MNITAARQIPGRLAVAGILVATLPTSFALGQPRLPEGARITRDVEYVPDGHERQKLDLYLPSDGKNSPLVVWIHGGAWQGGNKERPPALPLLRSGYAVASINYRLSQHARFPAQLEDCKAAIRWLRAHAGQYGYNADRIAVWGASAGGHLVALLGTTSDVKEFDVGENIDQSSAVQAVVDFFGPTDFLQINAQAGAESRLDHDAADSPESRLIGGPVLDNPEKAKRANPITYISAGDPPFLIMHGEEDHTVPIGQSELLDTALEKAGIESTLRRIPNAGHGFAGPEIARTVHTFLDRHLKETNNKQVEQLTE
jgi:acetyl esterase/lipase